MALVLSVAAVSAIAPEFAVTRTYGQTVRSRKVTNARSNALNEGLLKATEAGKENAIKELLDAGADINGVVDGDGTADTLLLREELQEYGRCCFKALELIQISSLPGDGSPLIMAARESHDAIARTL